MSVQFFVDVLPRAAGHVVLAAGPHGPSRQSSAENLATILARVLHAGQTPSWNFYFTPACYQMTDAVDVNDNMKGLRTAANCIAKRCVAFDVDLNHETKPSYDNKLVALGAMLQLCKKLDLDTPTYCVDSGRGLHFYWALNEDIPAQEWKRVMDALKPILLAADPKLFCDPTRVADLAGYLRLPGSWNTKSGTAVKFFTKPQGYAAWPKFVAASGASAPLPSALSGLRKVPQRPSKRTASAGMTPDDREPTTTDPAAMATRCGPLRRLAENPELQGYEAWFGAARLFARAVDPEAGRAAFHEFSKGHAGYNPAQADAKFTDAVNATRASPSCAQTREWAGEGDSLCQNCPMYRKQENGKPAALVDEFPPQAPAAPVAAQADNLTQIKLLERAMSGEWVKAADAGVKLPGYVGKDPSTTASCVFEKRGAMYHRTIVPTEHGVEFEDIKLAHNLIWIYGMTRTYDELGTPHYGIRYAMARKQGDDWWVKTIIVDPEVNAKRPSLHADFKVKRAGVCASDPSQKSWHRLFGHLNDEGNAKHDDDARDVVNRCGWFDADRPEKRRFVIGNKCYYPDGTVEVIDTDGGVRSMAKAMDQSGSMEEASRLFKSAFDKCDAMGKIVMLAGLGTPLVHANSVKGATIYIHGTSGAGKTLLTSILQSFYTKPAIAGMGSGRDTAASTMHLLGYASALPYFVDEATQMEDKDLMDMIMDATGGRERNRLESSANKVREATTWETMIFATSNKDLSGREQSAKGDAQMARAVTIDADSHRLFKPNQLPIDEARACEKNHGLIGAAFVQYVLKNYDAVVEKVRTVNDLLSRGDSPLGRTAQGDIRRVWRMVATVVVCAAHVAMDMGLMERDMNFLEKIAGRLAGAAELQAHAGQSNRMDMAANPLPVDGDGNVQVAPIRNDHALVEFTLDAMRRGGVSLFAVVGPDGAELDGTALISASNTGLIHQPYSVELMQLHVTLGSREVIAVVPNNTFGEWCRKQHNKIDPVHVVQRMRASGFIVDRGYALPHAGGAKLPAHPNSVSTVTTDVLGRKGCFVAKLKLTRPAEADLVLEWA